MTLERLAFAVLYAARATPLNRAKAAWIVWTMRGTANARVFPTLFAASVRQVGRS